MTFIRACHICVDKCSRDICSTRQQHEQCDRCQRVNRLRNPNFRVENYLCECNYGQLCQLAVPVERVNLDYIGTIERCGDTVRFCKHPINVPYELLSALRTGYLRKGSTLLDLQNLIMTILPELFGIRVDFISPWAYSESYIEPFNFEKRITTEQFRELVSKKENELGQEFDRMFPVTNSCSLACRDEQKKEYVDRHLSKFHADSKRRYLYSALRAIAYFSYHEKLGEIQPRSEVKMFSTDKIGWTNYTFEITDDITVLLQSNFGYGHASYFRIILKYKDIQIVAYSSCVNYYYANVRELCRYTRNYKVTCWSWDDAFAFVEEVSNLATKSQEDFINRWILGEVNSMVAGLHKIIEYPEAVFDKWATKTNPLGTRILLDVSEMDEGVKKRYRCYPEEMVMDLQAEKVSGALDFLGSLYQLKQIFKEVDSAIQDIKDMAAHLQPKLWSHIDMAREHVEELESTLLHLRAKQFIMTLRIDQHLRAIELARKAARVQFPSNTENSQNLKVLENIERSYRSAHPELQKDEMERVEIIKEIEEVEKDQSARMEFLKRLEKFENRILSERLCMPCPVDLIPEPRF